MQTILNGWPMYQVEIRTTPTQIEALLHLATSTPIACAAPTHEAIRAGVIARCATQAITAGRPVALTVTEASGTQQLAVHSSGIVQPVAPGQPIPDWSELEPYSGACRQCQQQLIVTVSECTRCRLPDPLRVELYIPIAPPASPTAPPAPETPTAPRTPPSDSTERAAAPIRTIVVHFTTGEIVTVPAPAVLGRKPEMREGYASVVLTSPTRNVSRTHALIDLDDAGNLIVTDNHSANGIFVDGRQISPTTPTIVLSGARIQLGDVTIRVEDGTTRTHQASENLDPRGVSRR